MIIQDQFGTIQNIQRALISQTSNWKGTLFCRFLQQTSSNEFVEGTEKEQFVRATTKGLQLNCELTETYSDQIPGRPRITGA